MEKMGREELVAMYRPDVERLVAFLPWLTERTGNDIRQNFEGENGKVTLPFPVYDTIMLAFLETLGSTVFMNPNYRYTYSRYRIKDWNDELKMIQRADIMSMDIIGGILSRYTLGGMTKAYLWTEGMDYQIFYNAVKRAKEIIEYWDVPIVVEAIGMEEPEEEPMVEEEPAVDWNVDFSDETVAEEIVEETVEFTAVEEVVEEAVAEEIEEPIAEEVEEPVAEEIEESEAEEVEEPVVEEIEEAVAEEIEEIATEEEPVVEEIEEAVAEEVEEPVAEEIEETVAEEVEEPVVEEIEEAVAEEVEEPAAEERQGWCPVRERKKPCRHQERRSYSW